MSSKYPARDQMAARFRSQSSLHEPRAKRGSESPTHAATDGPTSNGTFTERSNKTTVLPTVAATPKDVICGRGLHIMNRHGNLDLHLLANRYRQTYFSSTRQDKAAITRRVVQEIKSTGARFLRRLDENSIDDRWVEVDDKTAYKKVSHALRLRKSDHGKIFLKSVEMQQQKMNSNTNPNTTAQAVSSTPPEVTVATPLPQHVSANGLSHSSSSSDGMRLPYCPPLPENQLGSRMADQLRSLMAIHPISQFHDYARSQAQARWKMEETVQ